MFIVQGGGDTSQPHGVFLVVVGATTNVLLNELLYSFPRERQRQKDEKREEKY